MKPFSGSNRIGAVPILLTAERCNSGPNNWLLDVIARDKKTTGRVIENFGTVVMGSDLRHHPMVAGVVDAEMRAKMGSKKMTDYAWMSVAAVNPDIIFALRVEEAFSDDEPTRRRYIDASDATRRGESIPTNAIPKEFFAWRGPHDESKPMTQKLPHLATSGFWFVSSEAANVLRRFDLGGCKLHPVAVLMEDRKTPLPGSYFVLDFDNWKDVFLPEQSPEFPLARGSKTRRRPYFSSPDDIAVLSRDALTGADIWWSPNIFGAFFMSDGLVQALRAAGVDKPFSLRRCRIV